MCPDAATVQTQEKPKANYASGGHWSSHDFGTFLPGPGLYLWIVSFTTTGVKTHSKFGESINSGPYENIYVRVWFIMMINKSNSSR